MIKRNLIRKVDLDHMINIKIINIMIEDIDIQDIVIAKDQDLDLITKRDIEVNMIND